MTFQGRLMRHGGIFPVRVLRLFRLGRGQCENRWMDEHIKVAGPTVDFKGELIDDNLNSLTWWTDKHNKYASREAVDLLNLQYHFMPHDSVASLRGGKQAGVKRWVKEVVYARLPGGFRAFAYFFLPLRDPPGLSGWPGGHGVSLSAGLLVPVSGGCQGGGGAAVHAGEGCGCAGGDGAGFGGESGEI
jgi:hypothetical protein